MSLKNFLTAQKPPVAVESPPSSDPAADRTSWFDRDDAPPPPVAAQAEKLPSQPTDDRTFDDRTFTDNEISLPLGSLPLGAVDIVLMKDSPVLAAGASCPTGDELTIPPRPIRPTVEVLRRLEMPVQPASSLERDWTPTPFNPPQRSRRPDLTESSARLPSSPLSRQPPLSGPAALARALRATPAPHKEKLASNRLIAGHQRLLPVPGGLFLWRADYLRETGDLVIRSDSFDPLTVQYFFAVDLPPDLVTSDGLRLEADTISALVETFGDRRPVPGIAEPACVTRLTGAAAIKRPGQARAELVLGGRVGIGDLVETGEKTLASLSFGQSLRLDLANATRLRVDRWSHFSRTSGPILELTMLTGAFASIAAMSGVPPLVSMRTPCGAVSWCDASVVGQMALAGLPTMIALLRGALGVPGVLTVVNGWGTSTLSQSGHALLLHGHGAAGDPIPLTESLIDGSAFANLLPSRQREETFKIMP